MKRLLFASWVALVGCRLNPECFGSSECAEGSVCFEGACSPMAPDGGTYTWWRDVEPIVEERCQGCHDRPTLMGAPISLVNYFDVTAQASTGVPVHREMYRRVSSKDSPMPQPPLPALTEAEIDIFRVWTREGAPEGDPPYTWYDDVEPIVRNNCLACHTDPPQNNAPIPLVSWENTQAARAGRPVHEIMAERVDNPLRRMPPPPDFQPLAVGDINTIRAWSRFGAPRGIPKQIPDGGVEDSGMEEQPDAMPDGGANPIDGVPAAEGFGPMNYQFLEGPDWDRANNRLLYSDINGDTIYEHIPPDTFNPVLTPSNMSNGLFVESTGTVLVCEHGGRRVERLDGTTLTVVTDNYNGMRFNSPNDIVVRSDGMIYFSDPDYGNNPRELPFNGLFRLTPGGALSVEFQFMQTEEPNGLAFSPDESVLYVTDTVGRRVWRFDVNATGELSNQTPFVDAQGTSPDGLAVDRDGNVYLASSNGIEVYAPDGTLWGTIAVAEQPSNLVFGGPELRTLYITTARRLYRVTVPIAAP